MKPILYKVVSYDTDDGHVTMTEFFSSKAHAFLFAMDYLKSYSFKYKLNTDAEIKIFHGRRLCARFVTWFVFDNNDVN